MDQRPTFFLLWKNHRTARQPLSCVLLVRVALDGEKRCEQHLCLLIWCSTPVVLPGTRLRLSVSARVLVSVPVVTMDGFVVAMCEEWMGVTVAAQTLRTAVAAEHLVVCR